ncbi:hypothetical protein NDN08_000643 [Rhodosorus marinus]|uniref:Pherophorin domain-containing protein n=1 Tax=Rhodosorus marinus TaxID=101924 RepID=A0AAV8UNN6_9RHOD|nr:hypothetical protein NDN08_000643 [Rhodosorus marinus]
MMFRSAPYVVLAVIVLGAHATYGQEESIDGVARQQRSAQRCSAFANSYDEVTVFNDGNYRCYRLRIDGDGYEVGSVCVAIKPFNGKTCAKFRFQNYNGWLFTKVKAGVKATCGSKSADPFQVQLQTNYDSKVKAYVCLDQFNVFPGPSGEGCCNRPICIFAQAEVERRGRAKVAYPKAGKKDCFMQGIDDFSRCEVPLLCKNAVATPTPTATASPSASYTPSPTFPIDPTATASPSASYTPSPTFPIDSTATPTATEVGTETPTATLQESFTPTPSATLEGSVGVESPSATASPSFGFESSAEFPTASETPSPSFGVDPYSTDFETGTPTATLAASDEPER